MKYFSPAKISAPSRFGRADVKQSGRFQRGFTLVELLVVIGIVALLAALLFPVFASIRAKGRQTVCVSNLHQLSLAVFQYAQDSDDHYPYGGDPSDLNTDSWQGSDWDAQIQEMKAQNQLLPNVMSAYVKDPELWHCPADTGFDMCGIGENIPLDAHPTSFQAYGMSYAYTTLLGLQGETITGVRAWSRKPPYTEHDPADIPMLSDAVGIWHGGTKPEDERRNLAMLDGHVITVNQVRSLQLKRIIFTLPAAPVNL